MTTISGGLVPSPPEYAITADGPPGFVAGVVAI